MKSRFTLIIFALLATTVSFAEDGNRIPMLEQGKTWDYIYHSFEGHGYEETTYAVSYQLKGDTVINGRQYMKMYRKVPKLNMNSYYGAFREDEEGRVWQYDYGEKLWGFPADDVTNQEGETMICDITCKGYLDDVFSLFYPDQEFQTISDIVDVRGKQFHRYIHGDLIGIEGVGFEEEGLIHHIAEPKPTCVCSYESFSKVVSKDFTFFKEDFHNRHIIELTQEEKQMVKQSNDFSFNLFRKTRTEASQIISPLSVTYALGMLNNGADGQTQREILQVLGVNDVDAQNAFCLKMQNEFLTTRHVDNTKVMLSNTIFVNEALGWQLQDDFTNKINNYYYAYPEGRDFNDGQTMDVINKWASDHTDGFIEKVLDESEYDPFAVSYLLNAIYFKGLWTDPFEETDTREEPFAGGDPVPMMQQMWFALKYAENELYQMAWIPYGNGTYQMQILLPKEGRTLDEVVESLNGTNWQLEASNRMVYMKLPRFETSTDVDLKDIMSALGMPSAFSCEDADFSKLCVDNHGGNLYISLMKQVAKINLNEQGTVAAAVTIEDMTGSTGEKPIEFFADHPFLYMISEQSTGIILFIGQYTGGVTATISVPHQTKRANHAIYNLAGQRLSTPPAHGIYIRDGKKVMK